MTVPHTADAVGIRRAVRADLLDVVRIEREAFPEPWPYHVFERFLGAPGFLVADAGLDPGRRRGPVEERPAGNPSKRLTAGLDGSPGSSPADAEVVGYVVADAVGHLHGQFGHIKDLAVRADRRGEGIGSTLLERAMRVLADAGVGAIRLEVRRGNEAARQLYRSYGFERTGTQFGYYSDGEDAIVLVRNL